MVDSAIYSEVRGGIHPWFTGLAVVGGERFEFLFDRIIGQF